MIDLTQLGTLQDDGSIILYDQNIQFRDSMTGEYRRIRQSSSQKYQLSKWGFTNINSSFISGASVVGDDLRIRFHNGSVYEYYGMASLFDSLMRANSKGQYFNRRIRPTKNYAKIASLDFNDESGGNVMEIDDTSVFNQLDTQEMLNLLKMLAGLRLTVDNVKINGTETQRFKVEDIFTLYRPVKS